MILFLEDYLKYPGVMLDLKTNNKSALELAVKLKRMGVKNNSFFLVLFDQTLSGVDPHDTNLTLEQMERIGIECKINPWYVLREVARVPARAGIISERVQFNRSIICLWWCFFNHIIIILTQPRQTGKSFGSDLLMQCLMNFWTNNTSINLLTLSEKLRTETVGRIKEIYDEFPPYLKFKTRNDLNNTEELTIKAFNNKYRTHIAQPATKAAYNLGRGLSTPVLHVDEGPFQPNIEVALDACLPAMDAAWDMAAKNNEPHGIIYTTTAGKKDEPSGRYIYNMVMKSVKWTEKLYDCINREDLVHVLKQNKGVARIYAEFSHKQLGKTDQWLYEKLSERQMSPDAINRDYFNIWTSGTTSSPLPTALIEKIVGNIKPDEYQMISKIGTYITRWFIPEEEINDYMRNRRLVIGIDTSDGSGGDDLTLVGIDELTGETIMIGSFNETNLIVFAQWLVWLLETYENIFMIIERRSSAITIIDYLLLLLPQKGIDPFKRLFNWVVNDPLEHKERFEEIKAPMNRRQEDLYVRCKKYFGFATSGTGETSRSELYSTTLQNAAKRCYDKIKDKELIQQISGLVVRNGRVDHGVGEHDDLVIAWLLSHWFLTMGKNMSYYGFDASKVLTKSGIQKSMTPYELIEHKEQTEIRNRINELYNLLTNEIDPYISESYEREMRYLDSRLKLRDDENFSVDATINAAKEENKRLRLNKPNIHQTIENEYSHMENVVYMR